MAVASGGEHLRTARVADLPHRRIDQQRRYGGEVAAASRDARNADRVWVARSEHQQSRQRAGFRLSLRRNRSWYSRIHTRLTSVKIPRTPRACRWFLRLKSLALPTRSQAFLMVGLCVIWRLIFDVCVYLPPPVIPLGERSLFSLGLGNGCLHNGRKALDRWRSCSGANRTARVGV